MIHTWDGIWVRFLKKLARGRGGQDLVSNLLDLRIIDQSSITEDSRHKMWLLLLVCSPILGCSALGGNSRNILHVELLPRKDLFVWNSVRRRGELLHSHVKLDGDSLQGICPLHHIQLSPG